MRLDMLGQFLALGLSSADFAHDWETLFGRASDQRMHNAVAYYQCVVSFPAVNLVAILAFAPLLLIPFRLGAAESLQKSVVRTADRRALACTWAVLLIYAAIVCPQYHRILSIQYLRGP